MCAAGVNESMSVCVCVRVFFSSFALLVQARPQGRRQVSIKINSNMNKWVNACLLSLCVCVTPGSAAIRAPWPRQDSTTRQESRNEQVVECRVCVYVLLQGVLLYGPHGTSNER